MTAERVRARVFGEVADDYEAFRPDYPAALVDDVLGHAALGDAPALEVGAGTGKATVAFAGRGVAVTAIEPDEQMARVLRQRVAGFPRTTVQVASFEEFTPPQPYGLLFSAQAWHWTDPAVRWERATAALAPGGTLALFWNGDRPADPEVLAAIVAAHRAHAPGIDPAVEVDPGPIEDGLHTTWPYTELAGLPGFGDLSVPVYRRVRHLSSEEYVSYLSTKSAYRMLDPRARAALFRAILDAAGPRVTLDLGTALYLARRTTG